MAGLGYDGSIRINTLINSDGFLKELNKMGGAVEKQVKKSEKALDELQKKRKELSETAIIKTSELDAEKKKLEKLKQDLQDIKKIAKDTSLSKSIRSEAAANLPGAQSAVKEQTERVKMLQTEWNKIQSSIERYDSKIAETTRKLEQQRAESGKISPSLDGIQQELEQINQSAIVGNQNIISLSHKLAELQDRQKTLEAAGLGLGYKEYDENTQKIAQITAELKKYQSELQKTAIEQNKLQGFLGTLEQIKSSFSNLYNVSAPVFSKLGEGFANVAKTYKSALDEAIQKIKERLSSIEYFQGIEKAVSGIGDRLSNALSPKLEQIFGAERFQAIKTFAAELPGKIGPAISKVGEMFKGLSANAGNFATAFSSKLAPVINILQAVLQVIDAIGSAIGKRFQVVVGQIQSAIKSVQNVAKFLSPVAKAIDNVFSKSFSGIKSGVSSLGKGIMSATKSIVDFAKENNALTKITESVGAKLERLGGMIRRVFVFSVVTKGLRELRSELASYLAINEQFSNSLRTLQGVLLTAFQPIYDAALPAIITLIDIVSKAIAVVSQFIAVLFGTTAKKAQQNAKTLYEQAHAVKAVGSAAKQAAKDAEVAIAAFDEFNILSFPDSSSGGGGGGGGIEMPNFDYEYEDFPFDSWGEAFSAFLDKLLDGLPKLEAAFKDFADWLNDLSKKLYDMFTFPGVLDKVKALGKGLAEALNKLVNWIDWNQLGKALGAGLNLALNFLTSFLYAFDWMNLGHKLAEFVNGLVSEIDWYEFGRLLWAGFKIALETLAGFIMGLDMPLMAQAASNIIKGFFDEMYNTIQRIPWEGIGKQIATFLNNIDWYGSITVALKAISAAIEALFRMVRGFIDELDWSGIAGQIYQAINDSINLIDWFEIGRTISDAFIRIFDFLIEVISGIEWHEIGEKIGDLILGFDFVGALSGLAMLIAESINAAVQVACGMLDKVEPELKRIASGIAEGLKKAVEDVDWKKFGEVIGRAIKGALTFVAGLLDPSLFYSIGKAIGEFLVNLDWVGIVGGLAQVLAKAINSAVAAVKGFLDSAQPNLKAIADGIAEKINKFFDDVDWEELGKTISRGIEAALDFLIELIQQIDWDKVGRSIADLLANIDWDTLLTKWGQVVGETLNAKLKALDLSTAIDVGANVIKGLWNGMWAEFNASGGILGLLKRMIVDGIIGKVKGWLGIHSPSTVFAEIGKNIVAGLIQGIKETWSGILEFFHEKINAIVDFFNGAWDGIKEKTAAAWEAIKNTLGDAWNSIKEKAVEIFENIKKAVEDAWDGLREKTVAAWEAIKTAVGNVWDAIKKKADEIFEAIKKAVTDAWENLKKKTKEVWDNIKSTLSTLWDNIKTKAKEIFDNIKQTISTIWDNIKSKTEEIWNNLKKFLSDLWENIKKTATTIFENIKKFISDTWQNIKNKTSEIWNNIKTFLSNLWTELKNKVVNTFNEIKNKIVEVWNTIKNEAIAKWNEIKATISEKIENIKQTVREGFTRVKEAIVEKVTDAINALKNMRWSEVGMAIVNGIFSGLNGIFTKLKNWAKDVWNSVTSAFDGGSKSTSSNSRRAGVGRSAVSYGIQTAADYGGASTFQLPKLANGAVIPPNQQFLAILGDQRSGINIEAPLSTIKQAVADTIRDMGGMGGDIHITVESVLDGRVVARNTVKHINDMTTAAGRPVLLV